MSSVIDDPPPSTEELSTSATSEQTKKKRNVVKKFEGVLEFDSETQYQTQVVTVRKCSIKKLFSKAPWLVAPLKKMAKNMTAIASMTSRLLNFHVIRLIEQDKLDNNFKINQSFIQTTICFTLFVMGYKLQSKMDTKHPELFDSAKQFKALLSQKFIEEERSWFNFEVPGLTSCFNSFAAQHTTSCLNHLYVNFECRLGKLFHLRFDQQFPQMSKYKRRRYIGYMYRILLTDGDYVFRKKVDNDVLDFCNRIIEEVKSWFVFPKTSEAASSNAKRKDFISKDLLEKQQSRLLSFYAWLINELGAHEKKRFTLLPQCDLRTRNLMVDKTSADALVKKYAPLKETKKKEDEDEAMNETEEQTASEDTQNKIIVLTKEELLERMANNKFPLCELLDLKCVGMAERANRLWKPTSFQTDGMSASVTFQMPVIRNKKVEADGKTSKAKKKVVQRIAPLVGQIKLEEVSDLPVPLNQCRPYGNDPGRIRIASMVGRDGKPISLSGREYRFGNHVTRNNLKLQRLKDAAHMHLVEQQIKPSCTVSLTVYGEHVTSFFGQFSMLFDFYTRPAITRMKWDNYIMKQKFMDNWMNKHFGKYQDPQHPVVIAYGAASFSSTGKYQPPTPNKWFLDQLSRRYCVIMVDEYNTSKICSFCNHWEPMKPMTSHVKNEDTGKTEKKEVRGIRHCSDSCLTTHDRDKNAATNILNIMLHHLQGHSRPTCFCPAQEEKQKQETKKRKKKQPTEGEPPKKKTKKQKPTN